MDNEIHFDVLEHIGKLSSHAGGWTKEINIVAWNGGMPKVDIREWSQNHERFSRGITLTEDDARTVVKDLMEYMGREDRCDISQFEERKVDDFSADIIDHISTYGINERSGWTKECNLVSWNGQKPKVDIRQWDPEHERMSKGVVLSNEEAEQFIEVLGRRYGYEAERNAAVEEAEEELDI